MCLKICCILFIIACMLAGCTQPQSSGGVTDPKFVELRVMSFNIRYGTANDLLNHWRLRQGSLVKAIRTFSPDILGTQEMLAMQRDFLSGTLSDYAVLAAGRDDGKDAGEMTAIFYRRDRFTLIDSGHFWLSPTPEIPASVGWDAALTRMASWIKLRDQFNPQARPIVVLNAHLDHMGKQSRLESTRLIRRRSEEIGNGCSVIITGDFNCTEDDAPYRALFDSSPDFAPLHDTYRTSHPQRSPNEATFHAFDAGRIQGSRIDWIGAGDDWTVLNTDIDRALYDNRPPSDHFPVTAVLIQRKK